MRACKLTQQPSPPPPRCPPPHPLGRISLCGLLGLNNSFASEVEEHVHCLSVADTKKEQPFHLADENDASMADIEHLKKATAVLDGQTQALSKRYEKLAHSSAPAIKEIVAKLEISLRKDVFELHPVNNVVSESYMHEYVHKAQHETWTDTKELLKSNIEMILQSMTTVTQQVSRDLLRSLPKLVDACVMAKMQDPEFMPSLSANKFNAAASDANHSRDMTFWNSMRKAYAGKFVIRNFQVHDDDDTNVLSASNCADPMSEL